MTRILTILTIATALNVQAQHSLKDIAWLEGEWSRLNMKSGRTGHERWYKTSDSELIGFGVTLQGGDTVFVEKLRIILKEATLHYVADVPENKEPILFKFTDVSASGFICENPAHDFPKRIAYSLEGDKLKATISGGGKSIDYWFVRH
jgi:hypothetical protein